MGTLPVSPARSRHFTSQRQTRARVPWKEGRAATPLEPGRAPFSREIGRRSTDLRWAGDDVGRLGEFFPSPHCLFRALSLPCPRAVTLHRRSRCWPAPPAPSQVRHRARLASPALQEAGRWFGPRPRPRPRPLRAAFPQLFMSSGPLLDLGQRDQKGRGALLTSASALPDLLHQLLTSLSEAGLATLAILAIRRCDCAI